MRRPAACLALALAAAPAAAAAQVTTYTDLAAFLAITADRGTDAFDDLSPGVASAPLARSAGAFAYTARVTTTDLFVAGPAADRWLSANTATDAIVFRAFSRPVRAVGAVVFGTNDAGGFRPATSLVVRVTTVGGATFTRTVADATLASFLGFTADADIAEFAVQAVTPASDLAWPTVNNLVVAGTVIPEPATVALVGAGLAVAAGVVRRRARVTPTRA